MKNSCIVQLSENGKKNNYNNYKYIIHKQVSVHMFVFRVFPTTFRENK